VANLELAELSGVWGGAPSGGVQGQSLRPPEAESFFVFGDPKGGAIFQLTLQNADVRELLTIF